MSAPVPGPLTLPCGCRISVVEETETFVIEPCDLQCRYYLFALEESARVGNPVSFITDPEVSDG